MAYPYAQYGSTPSSLPAAYGPTPYGASPYGSTPNTLPGSAPIVYAPPPSAYRPPPPPPPSAYRPPPPPPPSAYRPPPPPPPSAYRPPPPPPQGAYGYPPPQAKIYNVPANPAPEEPKKEGVSTAKIIMFVVFVLIVIGAGILIWWLMYGAGDLEVSPTPDVNDT